MAGGPVPAWRSVPCSRKEVDLSTVLSCGQSFSWKATADNAWSNVLAGKIYTVTQTDSRLYWCVSETGYNVPELPLEKNGMEENGTGTQAVEVTTYDGKTDLLLKAKQEPGVCHSKIQRASEDSKAPDTSQSSTEDERKIISDYFALDVNLASLYDHWSSRDPHFRDVAQSFGGIRILQQDPTENLFSFICSSNNHISRISSMVNKLSQHFGERLGSVGEHEFHTFPTPERLARPDVESSLRQLGFGYRAKFIARTAEVIHSERPAGWLDGLRAMPYRECIAELMKLCGVGRKVADCVALMSLRKAHVVPVDTHVLQIAIRDYKIPGLGRDVKTMTPALHDRISEFFVELYGDHAGWAHTVLFTADLKQFSSRSDGKPKPKRTGKVKGQESQGGKKAKVDVKLECDSRPKRQRNQKTR